ncbi:MAG: hypothetical protein OSJ76_01145 [Alphaproteobacteria bacterium]|nr:hypothetical protein [Alphaproteobacteria bacterium]
MIRADKRNYRKHGDKNKALINKSLAECGAGRSILTDSEGNIIAGNGVFEQAQKLNIPVKIIETDGSELVVVQRTDLSPDDERRRQLAVMDNSTNDSSEFDFDLLSEDFQLDELVDLGIPELVGSGLMEDLEDGAFSEHINNASDIFSISFNFSKDDEEDIKDIIKKKGKEELTVEIRNLILSKKYA